MIQSFRDWRLLLGFILAFLLVHFTFQYINVFWYIYTATALFLIAYSIMNEESEDSLPVHKYLLLGIGTGFGIYLIFWVGHFFLQAIQFSHAVAQVEYLYWKIAPKDIIHYILLILILVPGEEFFWRGFIQKRLLRYSSFWQSIILTSILNASVYLFTSLYTLLIAALISGLVWGWLYAKYRSLPLAIISHLTFDLTMFLFLPLY